MAIYLWYAGAGYNRSTSSRCDWPGRARLAAHCAPSTGSRNDRHRHREGNSLSDSSRGHSRLRVGAHAVPRRGSPGVDVADHSTTRSPRVPGGNRGSCSAELDRPYLVPVSTECRPPVRLTLGPDEMWIERL